MTKKSETPGACLAGKRDRLDWSTFGFLENLLVFCAVPSRRAPKESGVQFRIDPPAGEDRLCLLFRIDRRSDPLVDEGLRPDYLALHVANGEAIATIIEMKGTDTKKLAHGVEQIKALRDRLQVELAEHLPGWVRTRLRFQGLLVTPFNTQAPLKRIRTLWSAGLPIHIVQSQKSAEVHKHVRKLHESPGPTKAEMGRSGAPPATFLEHMLACCALPRRLRGVTPLEPVAPCDREGIDIQYHRDGHTACLRVDSTDATIAASAAHFAERIRTSVTLLGLRTDRVRWISPQP